jgi:hypothetical protein
MEIWKINLTNLYYSQKNHMKMENFEIFNSATIRAWLKEIAQVIFETITGLPKDIRSDDKERTGIKILLREIGTRNLILESINKPSEAAQFFAIEKAVRSEMLKHYASQNSEDSTKMRFAGSITLNYLNKTLLQCSVSGLKAEEDVFIAVILLARASKTPVSYVIDMIELGRGELPDQFKQEGHYLNKMLKPYLMET